ncbi:MAG: MoaD/ThiS family protein [Gammaproteobacteria bacterium]|nr:MAG: MoaD/ThiS family protein [Gammaproteobacteria bacterium]
MKRVAVEYFAVFREQAGTAGEQLDTEAATAGDLFVECARRHGFADPRERCKVAVNDELAPWEVALADGDQVLFFPPVAGG